MLRSSALPLALLLPGALLWSAPSSAPLTSPTSLGQSTDHDESTSSSSSSEQSTSSQSSSTSDSNSDSASQSSRDSSRDREVASARAARDEAMRAVQSANRQGLEELKRILADKQTRAERAANMRREYTFANDGRAVHVVVEGVDVTATVDGKPVATERVRRSSDGSITILDGEGSVLGRVPGGRMFFGPGLGSGGLPGFGAKAPSPVVVGFVLDEPDDVLAAHLGVDPRRVSLVTEVTAGLPAAAAGLERYDLLVSVNGDPDAGPDRLQSILTTAAPGEPLELIVQRGAERRVLIVRPEAREQVADSEAFFALNESARILRQRIGDVGEVMVAPQIADGELRFQVFVDSPYVQFTDATVDSAVPGFPDGFDRELRDAVRLEVNSVFPGIAAWMSEESVAEDLANGWEAAIDERVDERLRAIEDRLGRIEALLERLVGGDT